MIFILLDDLHLLFITLGVFFQIRDGPLQLFVKTRKWNFNLKIGCWLNNPVRIRKSLCDLKLKILTLKWKLHPACCERWTQSNVSFCQNWRVTIDLITMKKELIELKIKENTYSKCFKTLPNGIFLQTLLKSYIYQIYLQLFHELIVIETTHFFL